MSWTAWIGIAVLILTLLALAKGYEVRLVLFLTALYLAGLADQVDQIVIIFFQGMADATSIIPICSAMGFAYVLRAFECDRHLVNALSRPLLYARWLVVPGTILIGFVVNITIISQTSTSLAVGTVLIPLLRSMGLKGAIIGASLLLGSSIGGELLNPGAPELVAIGKRLHIDSSVLIPEIASVVFIHLFAAMLVFLWLNRRDLALSAVPESQSMSRINWFAAIVPVVPIVLLFIFGPPLNLITWPRYWLVMEHEPPGLYGPRLIGLSMLVGCLAACIAARKQAGSAARHFFEGAGFGYTHIISLIVIAKCFSEGIKLAGITDGVGHLAEVIPVLLLPMAALLPMALAFLSGSGIGATQGLYPMLATIAEKQGIDPIHVGVLACMGAAAGRTMSLVAAVTLMCSQLTESKPSELSRRIAIPLSAGMLVVILIMIVRYRLR